MEIQINITLKLSTDYNLRWIYQGWVSGGRKPVSDKTRRKPARKDGRYHFRRRKGQKLPETPNQKFFSSKIPLY